MSAANPLSLEGFTESEYRTWAFAYVMRLPPRAAWMHSRHWYFVMLEARAAGWVELAAYALIQLNGLASAW